MQDLTAREFETDAEDELEYGLGEYEDELAGDPSGELGGQLGEGAFEDEWEAEGEWELEATDGEEFLRRIGRFVRKAAPVLRQVAKAAAPIVGTAVGGPLGAAIGRAASQLLEGEFEDELEGEDEFEDEFEGEFEEELAGAAPATRNDAVAELMASVAAQAQTEAEAEAMVGAATLMTISAADRARLARLLPHLVRGSAVLTRVLRGRRATRPAIRAVPTIVRQTSRVLAQRAASGQPVTRRMAGRVMAAQTRRVLASPRTCTRVMQGNVRATRVAARPAIATRTRRPATR